MFCHQHIPPQLIDTVRKHRCKQVDALIRTLFEAHQIKVAATEREILIHCSAEDFPAIVRRIAAKYGIELGLA